MYIHMYMCIYLITQEVTYAKVKCHGHLKQSTCSTCVRTYLSNMVSYVMA